MRPTFTRITTATATLIIGVFISNFDRHFLQGPLQPKCAAASSFSPQPTARVPFDPPSYPEDSDTSPFNIVRFVRAQPSGSLKRLWERLRVITDPESEYNFDSCSFCEIDTLEYDLDEDGSTETVLHIRDAFGSANRFLIFRYIAPGEARLIGRIDAGGRYPPADPVVFVSNGRAYLIVQNTTATGSGLAAWTDTVYAVSKHGVKPIVSYLAREKQSGELGLPEKEFVGRPVSLEIERRRPILTVDYIVEYSDTFDAPRPLFTKHQQVVLRGSLRDGSTVLDARSEVTPEEFDTIYNFDNMGQLEFLKFNRRELRAIAAGHDAEKTAWLKEFLQTCENSPLRLELLNLLH